MNASVPTRAGDVSYTILGEGRPWPLLHASLHDSHDFDQIVYQLAECSFDGGGA